MKKKIICFIIFVFLIMFGFVLFVYSNEKNNVYSILNEQLFYKNNLYVACELELNAVDLKKQIGVTHDGKQIYSIKGAKKNDFICLRIDGREIVYRNNIMMPIIDIKKIKANKMIVRPMNGIEDEVIIKDTSIINEMLAMIDDRNLVQGEVVGDTFHNVTLYSSKYKGISYSYIYVVDVNGDEYLYDAASDLSWKFDRHLFDVKMR